eukprot:Em0032g6a
MSRTLKKAVETAKQKKETEIRLIDEGVAKLDDVPELWSFQSLTRLVLSHNKITEIPTEVVELRGLEYLNLFNNCLEDLPSTISALPRLRELNIAMNRLCELPRGFGSFPALEVLDLTYNNLTNTSFSANFTYLGACLRALYLGDNDLTEFPPSIEKFVQLEVLVLRDNNISKVPVEIYKCPRLRTLHLQVNQINVVPPEITRLNLIGEKFSFKVNDNPLIHGLDEKLEMGLKQFVDFLKTDEYRGLYSLFLQKPPEEHTKKVYDRSGKKSRKTVKYKVPSAA